MTEEQMLDGCRRGDRDAQHELYARTNERVYRVLLRMAGDTGVAFDLAQETYLRAFSRIDQFDGRSSLATWLYRIAVNEALQHIRRERRTRSMPLTDDVAEAAGDADTDTSMIRLDLRGALAAMDPTDRAMLLLRYDEGLDYRAIAGIVDCAEGTVASRLHRARNRLRSLLATGYDEREEVTDPEHPMNGPARTNARVAEPESGGTVPE